MPNSTEYKVGVETSAALASLDKLRSALGGVAGVLGVVGVSFGAFSGAKAFADALGSVWAKGKELQTLHAITGQSITDLVTLRKAFSEAGLSSDSASEAITKLQRAIGGTNEEGQSTAHAFAQLGLSVQQLQGEGAVQQFQEIANALGGVRNEAAKTRAVTDLFGRDGAQFKALFADPAGIDAARGAMAGYAAIMERNAEVFKRVANTVESLKERTNTFFTGFADSFTSTIAPLLEKLKKSLDLTGYGEKFGQALSSAIQGLYGVFETGKIGEVAGLALRVGFGDATNWLSTKLGEIFQKVSTDWRKMFPNLAKAFDGIKNVFVGLAEIIAASIAKGILGGLQGVTVMGQQIIDDDAAESGKNLASLQQRLGLAHVNKGVAAIGDALPDQFKDFAKSLTVPLEEARKKLHQDIAAGRAHVAHVFAGPDKVFPAPAAGGAGSASVNLPREPVHALSDRLAKIGGFVGGHGGVLGERAAQDTARNTSLISKSMDILNKHMETLQQQLRPRAAAF